MSIPETPVRLPIPPLPRGFRLGGGHAGLKRNPTREDVALVVSDRPATAAGVYTTNLVFAAPVAYDRGLTPGRGFRGVVVNSGNANACTGERGLDDARAMAAAAALGTGAEAAVAAARGMMTTDTRPKLSGSTFSAGGADCTLFGMAKGAAMIGPRMATMLGVVLTDAAVEPDDAQRLLREAADCSFNCVSVDGHMSTNDTVLLLANGAAGTEPLHGAGLVALGAALTAACQDLAREIADDGEGATHVLRIDVTGCASRDAARRIARTVADSPLVKTAVHGADPNWGRIVSAAGYAGVPFDPLALRLHLNGTLLFERGTPVPFDADAVSQSIRDHRETRIQLDFGTGPGSICFHSSDLTADYVRLNADYHT